MTYGKIMCSKVVRLMRIYDFKIILYLQGGKKNVIVKHILLWDTLYIVTQSSSRDR